MTAGFLTIAVVVVLLALDYGVTARRPHVLVIIMTRFAVPAELQQRGIAAALVMRAVFMAIGAAAISAFSWTLGMLGRLVYLSLGLAVILGFIGVKLVLASLREDVNAAIPYIPTRPLLAVILGILTITTMASLIRVRTPPEEIAPACTVSKPTQHAESDEARG